jgi:hypothetical protein
LPVGGLLYPKKLKILTLWPAAVSKEMPTVLTKAKPVVNTSLLAKRARTGYDAAVDDSGDSVDVQNTRARRR